MQPLDDTDGGGMIEHNGCGGEKGKMAEYQLMHLPSGNTPRHSDGCRFLGLIFNNKDWDEGRYYPLFPDDGSVLFTDVVVYLGGASTGRGGEDPEIAAAVEAVIECTTMSKSNTVTRFCVSHGNAFPCQLPPPLN